MKEVKEIHLVSTDLVVKRSSNFLYFFLVYNAYRLGHRCFSSLSTNSGGAQRHAHLCLPCQFVACGASALTLNCDAATDTIAQQEIDLDHWRILNQSFD